MKREDAKNKVYCDYSQKNRTNEALIDKIYDQHEAELNELKNRSCEGCKYVNNEDMADATCTHEVMGSYYGMSFDIKTFCCNKWSKK